MQLFHQIFLYVSDFKNSLIIILSHVFVYSDNPDIPILYINYLKDCENCRRSGSSGVEGALFG